MCIKLCVLVPVITVLLFLDDGGAAVEDNSPAAAAMVADGAAIRTAIRPSGLTLTGRAQKRRKYSL